MTPEPEPMDRRAIWRENTDALERLGTTSFTGSFPERRHPLFFRKDGGMDLAQFFLLVVVVYVCVIFVLAGLGTLRVSTAAWAFLGSFVSLAFIAWAARDRAELIARSRTPGEIAAGIASTPLDTDDGRGP